MSTDVEIYQPPTTGQQVRAVLVNDEPWFVASDVAAALATATSPAVGSVVVVEWLGLHQDDGLVAHWDPMPDNGYYKHTTCGRVETVAWPYADAMTPCPACFSPDRACLWCRTHCDHVDRRAHQWLEWRSRQPWNPPTLRLLETVPTMRTAMTCTRSNATGGVR